MFTGSFKGSVRFLDGFYDGGGLGDLQDHETWQLLGVRLTGS